jgi:hypothetical protein
MPTASPSITIRGSAPPGGPEPEIPLEADPDAAGERAAVRVARTQKSVAQPVSSPTSAGWRSPAQNQLAPPVSSADQRARPLGSYLISVRSVVQIYPGPLGHRRPRMPAKSARLEDSPAEPGGPPTVSYADQPWSE